MDFISTYLIAPIAYLRNSTLVAPIILVRFLSYHCPFLLEMIGAIDSGPFPF
jgi:hypothetical protein